MLSLDQLEILSEVIPESFDLEFKRLQAPDTITEVSTFFYGFYLENKLFAFSSPKFLALLGESVSTNSKVRDFLLNLTDRVLIVLSVSDFNYADAIETLANGLTLNKSPQVSSTESLLPYQLGQALECDTDSLRSILKNNAWILVLYYLFLFMHKTTFYTEVKEHLQP